jgi:hypothetical protein
MSLLVALETQSLLNVLLTLLMSQRISDSAEINSARV